MHRNNEMNFSFVVEQAAAETSSCKTRWGRARSFANADISSV